MPYSLTSFGAIPFENDPWLNGTPPVVPTGPTGGAWSSLTQWFHPVTPVTLVAPTPPPAPWPPVDPSTLPTGQRKQSWLKQYWWAVASAALVVGGIWYWKKG